MCFNTFTAISLDQYLQTVIKLLKQEMSKLSTLTNWDQGFHIKQSLLWLLPNLGFNHSH